MGTGYDASDYAFTGSEIAMMEKYAEILEKVLVSTKNNDN